jgi:hypothetical protein
MVQKNERRNPERVGIGKLHPLGCARFERESRKQNNDCRGFPNALLDARTDTALISGLVTAERHTEIVEQRFDRP